MDKNLLKSEIIKKGLTIGQLAVGVGVNEAALYSRLSKSSTKPFTLDLASRVSSYLSLSPERAFEIFLKTEQK